MILFHLCIVALSKIFSKWRQRGNQSWFPKWINWIIDKLFKIMTFRFYIRSVLQSNQYLLISSINEIYCFDTSKPLKILSLIFAFGVISFCLLLIAFPIYLILSSYKAVENTHNKLEEFFTELKDDKKYKICTWFLLIRRIVLLWLLLTLNSITSRLLIGLCAIVLVLNVWYLTIFRPFEKSRVNVIEIINEIYFLLLMSSLIFLNDGDS